MQIFEKKTPAQVFPVDIAKLFKNSFLIQHLWWLLLTVLYGTVKLAGVPVLWFCISTCFRFWSKTITKRCTNNSLSSRSKTISCLLELIGHAHLISECFRKTLIAFDFDEILTKSVAKVTAISRVKILSYPALCGDFNFKVCIWKQKNAV